MLTLLYSDMGTPASYREMDGNGVHAYKWVNAAGEVTYVKYMWKTMQGQRNLTAAQAKAMTGEDWGHATTDLYKSIRDGKFPQWELRVQTLKEAELNKFEFNPLDATKIWPEKLVPSLKVGVMTLNRLPENFFEETEQAAFAPGNLVAGIEASEDRLLQGRLFSYFDTQRHRIGPNFQQVAINKPVAAVRTNNQGGALAARGQKGEVNYEPSDADEVTYADVPAKKYSRKTLSGTTMQEAIAKQNNFTQAGEQYLAFSEADRANLISNMIGDLSQVKSKKIQLKMVSYFFQANAEYGERLAKGLGLDLGAVKKVAVAD